MDIPLHNHVCYHGVGSQPTFLMIPAVFSELETTVLCRSLELLHTKLVKVCLFVISHCAQTRRHAGTGTGFPQPAPLTILCQICTLGTIDCQQAITSQYSYLLHFAHLLAIVVVDLSNKERYPRSPHSELYEVTE